MRDAALFDISPEWQETIERERRDGEQIVWAQRPVPRWLDRESFGTFVSGAIWTGFLIYLIRPAVARGYVLRDWPVTFTIFPLFVAIGLLMLAWPLIHYRALRRTMYVITDRDAIILRRGPLGGLTSERFAPDRLVEMRRVVRRDGSGDLIFDVAVERTGSTTQTRRRGFLNLADVRGVAARLELGLLRDRLRAGA